MRAGWRVLAIDREPAALETLRAVTPKEFRCQLETRVADLAGVEIPACDLADASLSLPFLPPDPFWATWQHHFHRIELVARRRSPASSTS